MEWLAQAMGWTTRRRDRPFRDLYEARPTPRQSVALPRDRNGSFFRPPVRGGCGDLASVTAGSSQLGADLPISCVLLCPYGAAQRSRGDGYAIAHLDDRGGAECRTLAQPRAPRAFPL